MRHRIRKAKLGRTTEHRTRMLNNLVCSLIKHRKVKTTLAKAKAARVVADKMVTLGKKGQADGADVQYRRLIAARLQQNTRTFFPKKKKNAELIHYVLAAQHTNHAPPSDCAIPRC